MASRLVKYRITYTHKTSGKKTSAIVHGDNARLRKIASLMKDGHKKIDWKRE